MPNAAFKPIHDPGEGDRRTTCFSMNVPSHCDQPGRVSPHLPMWDLVGNNKAETFSVMASQFLNCSSQGMMETLPHPSEQKPKTTYLSLWDNGLSVCLSVSLSKLYTYRKKGRRGWRYSTPKMWINMPFWSTFQTNSSQLHFKHLVISFKCLRGLTPSYCYLFTPHASEWFMCSRGSHYQFWFLWFEDSIGDLWWPSRMPFIYIYTGRA